MGHECNSETLRSLEKGEIEWKLVIVKQENNKYETVSEVKYFKQGVDYSVKCIERMLIMTHKICQALSVQWPLITWKWIVSWNDINIIHNKKKAKWKYYGRNRELNLRSNVSQNLGGLQHQAFIHMPHCLHRCCFWLNYAGFVFTCWDSKLPVILKLVDFIK